MADDTVGRHLLLTQFVEALEMQPRQTPVKLGANMATATTASGKPPISIVGLYLKREGQPVHFAYALHPDEAEALALKLLSAVSAARTKGGT